MKKIIFILLFIFTSVLCGCITPPTLEFSDYNINLKINETYELRPIILDNNGKKVEVNVIYELSNNDVVELENSYLIGVKTGVVTIKAKLDGYDVTKEINVEVLNEYSIFDEIVVGATPFPHAEILNIEGVKTYIESKGYKLKVVVYQDFETPNKALNDGEIDANYFQHVPYLTEEINTKGYKLSSAAEIHNEPLNLYGKEVKENWTGTKIYISNDQFNAERAYKLLISLGLIDTYSVENFDADNPVYTSSKNIKIECIETFILSKKVEEGGYAVIPGNYTLMAWKATKASEYKIDGETTKVAHPNIIVCRTEDLKCGKIKVLLEALAQPEVKDFIEKTYGPTVNYCFKSNLK